MGSPKKIARRRISAFDKLELSYNSTFHHLPTFFYEAGTWETPEMERIETLQGFKRLERSFMSGHIKCTVDQEQPGQLIQTSWNNEPAYNELECLLRLAWMRLNRLRTGAARSSMHRWGSLLRRMWMWCIWANRTRDLHFNTPCTTVHGLLLLDDVVA